VRRLPLLLALAGVCAGAAAAAPRDGLPGEPEVRAALANRCGRPAPEIRTVQCQGYEEEPTEFTCRFEQRGADGRWTRSSLTMAIDGDHWIDIGGRDCQDTNTNTSE